MTAKSDHLFAKVSDLVLQRLGGLTARGDGQKRDPVFHAVLWVFAHCPKRPLEREEEVCELVVQRFLSESSSFRAEGPWN